MTKHHCQSINNSPTSRREFLQGATAVAASVLAPPLSGAESPNPPLPTVPLAGRQVTRLIAGGNPLYGYSHFNVILDRLMVEYFTDEQVVKFLLDCEKAGINTWQSNYKARTRRQYPKIRQAGCKMNWLCLSDPWDVNPQASTTEAKASLISMTSISSRLKPARLNTCCVAGIGASSINTGSEPTA
jgi:hypothetical protein